MVGVAAAAAVVAYTRLSHRHPEAVATVTRAVRQLAAVVLTVSRAVEAVLEALEEPSRRTRHTGWDTPALDDDWDPV